MVPWQGMNNISYLHFRILSKENIIQIEAMNCNLAVSKTGDLSVDTLSDELY